MNKPKFIFAAFGQTITEVLKSIRTPPFFWSNWLKNFGKDGIKRFHFLENKFLPFKYFCSNNWQNNY